MRLTKKERSYLDQIYANAYKKYYCMTTDYGIEMDTSRIENAPILSYEDALALGSAQLEAEREHINAVIDGKIAVAETNYNKKAASINTEAQKRGLINSTIVLHGLQSALDEKTAKIESLEEQRTAKLGKLEGETLERTARKIHSEAVRSAVAARKLNMSIAQAKSTQQARSLTARMRHSLTPAEAQTKVDEEVYAAYLNFLFGYSVSDALALVTDEPAFGLNLSATYYTKLKQEMSRRGY